VTLFWLLVAHVLCDYPLQGDFLARGKNHKKPIPGVPWMQCLAAHALIHAGAVAFLTHSVALGFAEFVSHALIDYLKSEGAYSFNEDQALHLLSKFIWCAAAA